MRIIYSIVNFLILFGIIFLIGRRKIVSIFRDRRLGILAALDRAEAGFHLPESEPLPELKPVQNITDSAIRENTEKLEKLKRYELRDCRELELEKIVKERNLLLKSFTEKVRVLYAAHNTDRFEQQRNRALLDLILQQIRLTDGDRCYLRQHGVLYVTLTGASPLSQELIARADAATTALLATVGGKTSFRVAEKPELIGGVRLRIGDTVYDATVAEELYQITAVLEKRAVEETDTVETLLACLTDRIGEKKSVVSVYQLGRVLSVS
ncbi:MAG: F0F1 ATP synthase subunit delta, partial [Clostridia bacterium]|nr:F0F1 ATP synthase subunit delta [Clostridia bacterium]